MASFFSDQPTFLTCWGCQSGWVYFTLRPGSDPAAIEAALPAWETAQHPRTSNMARPSTIPARTRIGTWSTSATSTSASPRKPR